jgi:hypothetical protein
MSTKIFKLVLIKGFTEAYYQLSEEDKANLWERIRQNVIDKAGAKTVTPFYDCRWANDQYESFFVIEYPNVEAAIMDTAGAEALELFRYLNSETILGIERSEGAPSTGA